MHPTPGGYVVLAVLAIALVGCGAALAAGGGKPVGTFAGCPRGLQPLAANWQPTARRAALTFLNTTYATWSRQRHWGLRLAGAKENTPFLVRHWLPSGWIKSECGLVVWKRSVGVTFEFPAMEYPNPRGPCNACAHVTLLFGDTKHGWIAWGNH